MKFANQDGRFVVVLGDDQIVDVEKASVGRFGPSPEEVFAQWSDFRDWMTTASLVSVERLNTERLGAPSPRPPQVFGIGLNYKSHVAEAGMAAPDTPLTFTKFPSSVIGPSGDIPLTGPQVDWEVELVVVIGQRAHRVSADDAWDYVAGVTLGQDISDREVQTRPKEHPQFNLGKSAPGFSPIGPFLVTPDELRDPNDVQLGCSVNGQEMQNDRTTGLIFNVADLIEYLSGLVILLPGDLIFTGTPPGVGVTMDPPRFLAAGDELVSSSSELGQMRHQLVGPRS
jgi:2,4-didehydro-3-deoxy-L-rhamnonate hydrolase